MTLDDGPKVGWGLIGWSPRHKVNCNVPACGRAMSGGYVRADNKDPRAPGFIAICIECWFKIACGVDPDPDAKIPSWEEERRAKVDP